MPNEKCQMTYGKSFLPFLLNSEPRPQPQLQPVHLAIVCLVVIAAKVQQAMQNELRDFLVEAQTVFLRLPRRLLNRDHYVSQPRAFSLFKLILLCWKREHVCCASL